MAADSSEIDPLPVEVELTVSHPEFPETDPVCHRIQNNPAFCSLQCIRSSRHVRQSLSFSPGQNVLSIRAFFLLQRERHVIPLRILRTPQLRARGNADAPLPMRERNCRLNPKFRDPDAGRQTAFPVPMRIGADIRSPDRGTDRVKIPIRPKRYSEILYICLRQPDQRNIPEHAAIVKPVRVVHRHLTCPPCRVHRQNDPVLPLPERLRYIEKERRRPALVKPDILPVQEDKTQVIRRADPQENPVFRTALPPERPGKYHG